MTEVVFFEPWCGSGRRSWPGWLGIKAGRADESEEQSGVSGPGVSGPETSQTRTGPPQTRSRIRELREVLLGSGPVEAPKRTMRLVGPWSDRRFLRHRVESPLLEGLERGAQASGTGPTRLWGPWRIWSSSWKTRPLPRSRRPRNLADVVQEVTREFAGQSTVLVKVQVPQEPIRVRVEPEAIKDAIFLILHNAGEFGDGQPVEMTLGSEEGKPHSVFRDQGPGFTAEALLRAMDPFYSTSPGGLGLGLPHARRAVNSQGGEVFLQEWRGWRGRGGDSASPGD